MTTVAQELFQTENEELISGSEAIALGCALADVDVITAYPIRPYDTVMQYVSKLKADGAFDCDFIVAESEHSQFEIVKHASAVGARTFSGSSGVGWFYAFEAITVTAGLRMPVVAMVGNTGPWTTPAPLALSTTTLWRYGTWAGFCTGWQRPRRPWTPPCWPGG